MTQSNGCHNKEQKENTNLTKIQSEPHKSKINSTGQSMGK